ncbi:hypothetical protein PENSPDRAFT_597211 [Peniophora sp. CONT]|nr:hypothetical protein PENSPDRAFT_597211 [Peniophora sp. CONT]
MSAQLPSEIDLSNAFPDNVDDKVLYLQAAGHTKDYQARGGTGDRHVVLCWDNNRRGIPIDASQMIHLKGSPGGWYLELAVKQHPPGSATSNTRYTLGTFTRTQRDCVLALAKEINFDERSRVNTCRVWTRDLLEAMAEDHSLPLTREKFEELDREIPLLRRKPEV